MDLTILEAIKYIKQISKKKVSLENLLRRINKTNATNIDTDTLRIDVDNMLRNGIIDQDYKILKNHIDGDVRLDFSTIHFSTEKTNNTNENKNSDLPFPLTQVTPNKSDKDPTLVIITLKIIQQFSLYRLLAHKKRQTLKHKVLFPNTKITKNGSN